MSLPPLIDIPTPPIIISGPSSVPAWRILSICSSSSNLGNALHDALFSYINYNPWWHVLWHPTVQYPTACEVGWSPLRLIDAVTGTQAGPSFRHFSLCIIEHPSMSLLSTPALIIQARQNLEEVWICLGCNGSVVAVLAASSYWPQSLDWMQVCCCAPCNCCCAVICFEQSTITVCKDCRDNASWCSKTCSSETRAVFTLHCHVTWSEKASQGLLCVYVHLK